MNRKRGAVGLLLLKWIVIPAALVGVGYFLVGPFMPRILGSSGRLKVPAAGETATVSAQETTYGEPEVEVSSAPAASEKRLSSNRRSTSSGQRRRRRSESNRVRVYKEEPAKEQTAPVDDPPAIDPDSPPVDPPDTDPPVTTTGGG